MDGETGADNADVTSTGPATAAQVVTTEQEDWSEAKTDPNTGVALDGHDLPVNHRLRAEALADMGKDEDPANLVTPELIADTADRLERERKARPPVNSNMKVSELERIARREGIDISEARNNEERVSAINSARGEEVA